MIIGPKKLLKLVKTKKIVENLSKRELTSPEGAGFDLRLGEIYQISGRAFLGIKERQTPKIKLFAKYQTNKTTTFTIKPGKYYLITTIEKVNTPKNIVIDFKPRTTTFRSGLFLRTSIAHPGYCGKLTFGLKNEGPVPVTLELGCRIVHAQFHQVEGVGNLYRGQWQGGRVTTKKREKQI
jgi:deoxycytidine triphosphate deaminase